MSYFIAETISRLLAPRHEFGCSWLLWRRLVKRLRERGQSGTRESGAFLLGHRLGKRARVVDFVLYDDLDPNCLTTGIVRFDGRYYGALWDLCGRQGTTVVADIHVHPGGAAQSDSDRAYPMIARPGHLALILPWFAAGPIRRSEVGMYRYLGAKQWEVIPAHARTSFFCIGL
jgi:proteasome lid subunit RPN8/RPN11